MSDLSSPASQDAVSEAEVKKVRQYYLEKTTFLSACIVSLVGAVIAAAWGMYMWTLFCANLVLLMGFPVFATKPMHRPEALLQFAGTRPWSIWRQLAHVELGRKLWTAQELESEPYVEWGLLAEALGEARSARLRTKILLLAAKFGRIDMLPAVEERYATVDLYTKKVGHAEAAALSQARRVLRQRAAEAGNPRLSEGGDTG